MFSLSSLLSVFSLFMFVGRIAVALPVVPLPLRGAHGLEDRSLTANNHVRAVTAMPPSDVITVYVREDIPDSIPTMAQNGDIIPFANPGHRREQKRQIPDSTPTMTQNGEVVPFRNPGKLRRAWEREVDKKRLEAKDVAEDELD